jgi:hypothetical protein
VQRGYTYLHPERGLIAYNLDEEGMERRLGPALPYEAAMVGARTAHEWGHFADDAGWVPCRDDAARHAAERALAEGLDEAIAAASPTIRRLTEGDLTTVGGGDGPGVGLAEVFAARLPDFCANLVVAQLAGPAERESYGRHNVRALGAEYSPAAAWRLVVRYLYEYQYLRPALGLLRVPDPWDYFAGCTGVERDLVARGVIERERFEALAALGWELLATHAIDERRLRFA